MISKLWPQLRSSRPPAPIRAARLPGFPLGVALLVTVILPLVLPASILAVTPDNVHPRMYFFADSVNAVRNRCVPANSANHGIYLRYKSYVDGLPSTPTGTHYYYMQHFAAMYLLSGQLSYADKAINLAMMAVDLNAPGFTSGQGNGLWGTSQLMEVYDWCYPVLTAAQKQAIQNAVPASVITENPSTGRKYMYLDGTWYYKYVMIHDAPYSNDAQAGLDRSLTWLDECMECGDQLMPQGSSDEYYGKYYAMKVGFLETLKHSAHVDKISGSPHMRHSGRFWTAIYRPDRLFRRIPAKYNPTMITAEGFFAWQGSRLRDRRAQALIKEIVDSGIYREEAALSLLLYYIPTASSDVSSTPGLSWYDPYGWYAGRTGWRFGSGSTDILTFFHISPSILEHRGVLHYEVQRGLDDLIPKSAYYEGDTDLHFRPWLNSAVAFNTILIYDPAENFGDLPNAGQQTTPDDVRATQKWGECFWPAGTGYQGEITTIDTTQVNTYVLIEADASAAYAASKASKVLRKWYWRKPGWIVVWDRVVLSKDNLPVKSLVHTIERPIIGSIPTAIRGSWDVGGVFTTPLTTDRSFVANYRDSSVRVYVLLAEASGGYSGAELRFIGGASRLNQQHWRQALDPSGFGYVSNPADTSYEFYIESTGGNYMPSTPSRVNETDVEHRFDRPPRVACDWRTEITVSGARDTVDIAYLVHVAGRYDPPAVVNYRVVDSVLDIRAWAGQDTLIYPSVPPGETTRGRIY